MGLSGWVFPDLSPSIASTIAPARTSQVRLDYGIARAGDLPLIEMVWCNKPNSLTPGGMKGMSEGGVMGAIGAVSAMRSPTPYGRSGQR